MEIYVFILLALVWAAFLLPSFYDSRRKAPIASTRSFARSTALLASVATRPVYGEIMARQRVMTRRRRILSSLALGAFAALLLAIAQNSVLLLMLALAFDVALAAYIAILLHVKQQHHRRAAVVPMPLAPEPEQPSSVRVVAG